MEIVMKNEPLECVYCGSENIQAGTFNPETAQRTVVCNSCGLYWCEIFNFDSVQIPENLERYVGKVEAK